MFIFTWVAKTSVSICFYHPQTIPVYGFESQPLQGGARAPVQAWIAIEIVDVEMKHGHFQ